MKCKLVENYSVVILMSSLLAAQGKSPEMTSPFFAREVGQLVAHVACIVFLFVFRGGVKFFFGILAIAVCGGSSTSSCYNGKPWEVPAWAWCFFQFGAIASGFDRC